MERIEMIIRRRSMFSGHENTMDLPVTQEQLDRWADGELVQSVFSFLSPAEREFIMTGVTDEEWNQAFSGL